MVHVGRGSLDDLPAVNASLFEVKGRVFAIVVYTGDSTALGNIAQSINKSRARSSLELQIEHFVHLIAGVAMAVGILSCLANIFSPQKRSWAHILENSATAFFAQVPEGLLPTVRLEEERSQEASRKSSGM